MTTHNPPPATSPYPFTCHHLEHASVPTVLDADDLLVNGVGKKPLPAGINHPGFQRVNKEKGTGSPDCLDAASLTLKSSTHRRKPRTLLNVKQDQFHI